MSIESPVLPKAILEQLPSRVVVEHVSPEIDGGRFPIKRVVGEEVQIEADIHADGHDLVDAVLRFRFRGETDWRETAMQATGNDRFRGSFIVDRLGWYEYTVEGWISRFGSWQREILKKFEAGQNVQTELIEGAEHLAAAAERAPGHDAERLRSLAQYLRADQAQEDRVRASLSEETTVLMDLYADREPVSRYRQTLQVKVDPVRARYGAWYELFPRSTAAEPGRHGTFHDTIKWLPYIAEMGFDVLYLPPVHPIGRQFRKGPNNTLTPGPNDPGSPWAIGGAEGGHKSIHPELGTFEDFDQLVDAARDHGLEIALDIAFQCSPDHPYVKEHPEWFRHRPDGTIKYAENPPKKYQDIYPLDFESENWPALWEELKDVFLFWIGHGVKIFRVDNPHTKHFRFWEWCIREIQEEHPETIFLSEAFTRPKVMKHLAKSGYTQSYTYFTWRNAKWELMEYLTELTQSECREYMRPNFFANTPDILHAYLQHGGRPAFQIRQVLASTLSATYGIYGPVFELAVGQAVREGSEEYLDSEKYQVRHWDLTAPHSLKDYIAAVNRIRRENPALHENWNLKFLRIDNDQLIAYTKTTAGLDNVILCVVNLDPNHTHSGWVQIPLDDLNLSHNEPYQVHDLLTDARYQWQGEWNYVMLDPHSSPAHIFKIRRPLAGTDQFV